MASAIFTLIVVILSILTEVFLLLYLQSSLNTINSDQCYSQGGAFGVQPNTSALPLQKCGEQAKNRCQFTEANLNAAITKCDDNPAVCSAFTYNEISHIMDFVDPYQTTPSNNVNLFTRQAPMVIKT